MVTIYELLEVEEDASKEEIEKAYSKMVFEFRQDINFDAETNKENEMILNKLKLAYEILSNDEKRERYDKELAKIRAEELIKNISISKTENDDSVKNSNVEAVQEVAQKSETQKIVQEQVVRKIEQEPSVQNVQQGQMSNFNEQDFSENEDMLTKNEKNKIKKAAQNEFKQKLKKAKQAEEEYKAAYKKAYNDYLRKAGYKVKEPLTLKRIKSFLIGLLVLILIAAVIWFLPPTRRMLISLYEENFIIKALVDLVKSIIELILDSGK